MSSIMKAIKQYVEQCPYLEDFAQLFPVVEVDQLQERPVSYMIERAPAAPVVRKYVDGSAVCQVVFYFASRHTYAAAENIDTNEFYDQFSDWLKNNVNLLQLPEGLEVRKMETSTGGYLISAEDKTARYQIQCRLEYYKPA